MGTVTSGDWVLVPRHPTDGMLREGSKWDTGMDSYPYCPGTGKVWAAMLAAAPQPPAETGNPVSPPAEAQPGWYCAHCQRGVDAREVTYSEQHEVCGRYIANDEPPPPSAPEAQPVAWQFQDREGNWHEFIDERHRLNTIEDGSWPIRALYAHPPPSAPQQASDLSRSLKLAAAEEQAEAWQAVCALLSELRPGWAAGPGSGQELALAAIRHAFATPPPSAPVGDAEDMVLDAIEWRAPSAPVGSDRWKALIGQWQRRVEAAGYDGVEDALDAAVASKSAPVGVEGFKPMAVAFVNSDGRPEWINPDWPEVPRDPHAPLYSKAEVLRALAHQPAAVCHCYTTDPTNCIGTDDLAGLDCPCKCHAQRPATCVGCEGKPAPENTPCAACGQQPAAIGEEIMVNAAHDVYTLPLQPSGLSSGPRFVVHVPGPEQPAADPGACPACNRAWSEHRIGYSASACKMKQPAASDEAMARKLEGLARRWEGSASNDKDGGRRAAKMRCAADLLKLAAALAAQQRGGTDE